MHVLATAGHVDHGKSALVRALTGMEPDRYAEEQRRGLTIDLGFAWARLGEQDVAFVDVPGHERFVATMLAGVGPVPAVLLVVAADGGWMPQSQEHLDALHALGVRHGLLVVSRTDLADPGPTLAQARERLARTSLAGIEDVAVSARTGAGMDRLRAALGRLVAALPPADPRAPVRLWVDRAFSVRGAGTVVTGTLGAGSVRPGDRLELDGGRAVTVRGVQSLDRPVDAAHAVARVALNLRGAELDDVRRGDALTTPGTHLRTTLVDARLRTRPSAPQTSRGQVAEQDDLPRECLLHLGSAQVQVVVRPLGQGLVRLRLRTPLPLRVGDIGLLRDPGRHLVLGGVTALDVDPPKLDRRGAAASRARQLGPLRGEPDAATELARRGVVRLEHLRAMGVPQEPALALPGVIADGGWLLHPELADRLRDRLSAAVGRWARDHPLDAGVPVEAARQELELPTRGLVEALVREPLRLLDGRVLDGASAASRLPPPVREAVQRLVAAIADRPFAAPEADRLRELGLGPRELAAAVRAGALERVTDGIYLAPGAVAAAAAVLEQLPQPFSVSMAKAAWGTSRRVALPLIARLDGDGITLRLPDDTRRLRARAAS